MLMCVCVCVCVCVDACVWMRASAVIESTPALTGIAELCANLKATANLTRFTVGMRHKFKEYALREEHK